MKIGLIDVDGHNFPNLALMKISTFHKKNGDIISWYDIFGGEFDIVYLSKVFTFSNDYQYPIYAKNIIKGGTGYDVEKRLPLDIEICDPDYSIYPQFNFSIQFFSRGCIRQCPFCAVQKKEGFINTCKPKLLNPNGKYIEVLDNNFFANTDWKYSISYLNDTKQYVNLHGVDVRLMDKEKSIALNSLKLKGSSIHIAWDNPKEDIIPNIIDMLKYVKSYKITCYVLIGYWSTIKEDYYRVKQLEKLGIDPFVQPYRDFENKRKPSQYEKDFAGWVNKKERFKAFDFKEFMPRKGFKCSEYFKI